ncbi:hypothetical protein CDAR_440111 [Caerostris darwini]|uniref:Uncharacterized protein n=1 Tax=Caerostris darwini TaxID=1538125 RepID=A0AAV4RPF0_9ARAC|nr:hypothetical protein CDAR_440111 [Caerostris darwini]
MSQKADDSLFLAIGKQLKSNRERIHAPFRFAQRLPPLCWQHAASLSLMHPLTPCWIPPPFFLPKVSKAGWFPLPPTDGTAHQAID